MSGSKFGTSSSAKNKGVWRKRRRHRAERREATWYIREAINRQMRAIGHPGWGIKRPRVDIDLQD